MKTQTEQLIAHANQVAKANFMQFDYDEDNPITDLLQAVLVIAFDNLPNEIDHDILPVFDELNNSEKHRDTNEVITGLWTDANMALDEEWDRSDSGFESQIILIEELAGKHGYELSDTREPVEN